MTTHMSVAEFRTMQAKVAKPTKYKSKATVVDGIRFPSKRQAGHYVDLMRQKRAGLVSYFLMEVPFRLPGGTIYRADFVVFYPDGTHRVLDSKGLATPAFKIKKREVEATYPVEIHLI